MTTARELRRAMRQQRRELRKALPALRREARARLAQLPAVQRARRRRQVRRALVAAAVLVLLLLIRCDCSGPAPAPATPEPPETEQVKPLARSPKKVPAGPLKARVETQPRPALASTGPASPPWLDEFRLQVAARSPRLAECFKGAERPGALRWSTSVNPQAGTVSDHQLELVGVGADLSAEQCGCLVAALGKPTYKLTAATAEGLPDRVSLVIEF